MIRYDRKKLGKFIQAARKAAEVSQTEMAGRLGYTSSQFISNIESGRNVAPLRAIAKMLKIYKADPEPVVDLFMEMQEKEIRQSLKSKR